MYRLFLTETGVGIGVLRGEGERRVFHLPEEETEAPGAFVTHLSHLAGR